MPFDRYFALGYHECMRTSRIALAAALALTLAVFALACGQSAADDSPPELSTFSGEPVQAATPVSEMPQSSAESPAAAQNGRITNPGASAANGGEQPAPHLPSGIPNTAFIAQSTSPAPPPVGALTALPSIASLVDEIEPAVVSISVESVSRGMFFDFTDEGAGTGTVIRPDGYIVTNFHVIQGANDIQVTLASGNSYDADVVGYDIITDLAVLKIDDDDLATIRMGDSDALDVGDWVVALGNALALKGGPTVTLGIVSARGRTLSTERGDLYDLIQTDAAINDGNSGGPLINLQGEVIGINTAIIRRAQGIGFAISSTAALPIIDSLIEHGRVVRPLIGLTGADVTPARANQLGLNVDEGIIVTRMTLDGPAYEAGIRVGDVITKLNDIPTPDMAAFLTLLWTFDIGQEVQVEYIHENETQVTGVTLVERPSL